VEVSNKEDNHMESSDNLDNSHSSDSSI